MRFSNPHPQNDTRFPVSPRIRRFDLSCIDRLACSVRDFNFEGTCRWHDGSAVHGF